VTPLFVYGTLRHPPLLAAVSGAAGLAAVRARLPGHATRWARGERFPLIVREAGAEAPGLLLEGLSDEQSARLDFYEIVHGYDAVLRQVEGPAGPVEARVYLPPEGHWQPGAAFALEAWAAEYGAVVTAAATEVMAARDRLPPAAIRARYPQILVRAASRLRAATPAPARLRHAARPGDVEILAARQPYAGFFALEEDELRHRRFDGTMSAVLSRAAFVSGDAATVLPWDPARDRVLVIEQFRMGPQARGDANPWVLEPIAGRVDPFETPADCARREAREEAGIAIGRLFALPGHYPSPGAKSEFLHAFVGLADLPDGCAGLGGAADEGEDIRAHLLSLDDLLALIDTGEVQGGPLILSALWLARHRDRLRAGDGGTIAQPGGHG